MRKIITRHLALSVSSIAISSSVHATCGITGITLALQASTIEHLKASQALVYSNPLAIHQNALEVAKHSHLKELSHELLAGLVLSLYHPFDLLVIPGTMSALEANTMLCAANKDALVKAIQIGARMRHTVAELLPQFSLNPQAHMEPAYDRSFTMALKEWLGICLTAFPRTEIEFMLHDASKQGIVVHKLDKKDRQQLTLAKLSIRLSKNEVPHQLSEMEEEAELSFMEAKEKGKELLNKLLSLQGQSFIVPKKLQEILKTLFMKRNLNACNQNLRTKICNALLSYQHPVATELSALIKAAYNPYDIFAKAEDHMESALDTAPDLAKPKRSLAEILAAKAAKEQGE